MNLSYFVQSWVATPEAKKKPKKREALGKGCGAASETHWIGLFRKILPRNHGFPRQI